MTSKQRTVATIHGNRYRLGRELGRGGQGAVYAVEGDRLAVKVLRDRSERARERLRDQLAYVGRLPLEDLAVARPLEQLRAPHVGYVMELYTGMAPVQKLMYPPRGCESLLQWYIDGGGLRRRLRLLARSAGVFAELHGRGLVYVDPSPHNVFVSEDVEGVEIRLIDTDNLRTSGSAGRSLYTPGYGAPEIVSMRGVPSTLSDAHAFAVMAFEALALVHPLCGDLVRDGEPEVEERALAGELPWIDHPLDDSNRSSDGIPRDLVLSSNLKEDFDAAFGAGLYKPGERPGMARWVEHLHRAADRTICCPGCKGTYYYTRSQCPWCDGGRPAFVIAAATIWDPDRQRLKGGGQIEQVAGIVRDSSGKPRVVDALAITEGERRQLPRRLTLGTGTEAPQLSVEFNQGRLRLEAVEGARWHLTAMDGSKAKDLSDLPVELAMGRSGVPWLLHAGSADRLHRVIRFDLHGGGDR